MSRWAKFLIAILLGLVVGLVYGWVVSPVEYIDVSPDTLRSDYCADYILMVAEVYHADQNIDQAAQRMAMLGVNPPDQMSAQALQFGLRAGFAENDLQLLRELASALQAWQLGRSGVP